MTNNYFILFAWSTNENKGGMNDCCGTFSSAEAAEDFFTHSTHCSHMNYYQIFDIIKREVIWEGNRDRRSN
jgi:hypothetical protein